MRLARHCLGACTKGKETDDIIMHRMPLSATRDLVTQGLHGNVAQGVDFIGCGAKD